VLLVVAADGEHIAARWVERRQLCRSLQRQDSAGAGGDVAGPLQSAFACIDQAKQVVPELAEVGDLVVVALAKSAQPSITIVPEHHQLHVSSMFESSAAARSVPAPRKSSSNSCRLRRFRHLLPPFQTILATGLSTLLGICARSQDWVHQG